MSKEQLPPSLTDSYDHESQTSGSLAKLQRTLDAVGDRTALIIKSGKNERTLTCYPLGVEYKLMSNSKWWQSQALTCFTRRDTEDTEDVTIAEWELKLYGTDRLRYLSADSSKDFFPTKTYLKRQGWYKQYLSVTHRFEVDGRGYMWRSSLLSELGSMQLYAEGNDEPLARTVGGRCLIKPRYGFIEISHDDGILDEIVVTWAIARQRNQERAALFNLIHSLLIEALLMTLLEVLIWSHNHD